jgi:hypothetical protein
MTDRRTLLIWLAWSAIAVAPALAAGPAQTSPREVVEQIYKVSAGRDGKYQGPSAFTDAGIRKRFFSRSLLAAVVKMEKLSKKRNEPILGFDPVTNSQDPDVKDLQIAVESQTPARVVVAARFLSFDDKEPSIVRYALISEAGAWRIDDIQGEHGKDAWSLREIIR